MWTTQTALISCLRIGAQALFDLVGIDAAAPVGFDEFRLQAQLRRHGLPQRREMSGLEHQDAIAGRQQIGQGRFPGAGAGGRIEENMAAGAENRLDTRQRALPELLEFRAAMVDVGRSMARKMRSGTGVGPGICRKCRPAILGALVGMAPRTLLAYLRLFFPTSGSCRQGRADSITTAMTVIAQPRTGTAPESRRRGRSAVRRLQPRPLCDRCLLLSDDAAWAWSCRAAQRKRSGRWRSREAKA